MTASNAVPMRRHPAVRLYAIAGTPMMDLPVMGGEPSGGVTNWVQVWRTWLGATWTGLSENGLRDALRSDVSSNYRPIPVQLDLGGNPNRYTTARQIVHRSREAG